MVATDVLGINFGTLPTAIVLHIADHLSLFSVFTLPLISSDFRNLFQSDIDYWERVASHHFYPVYQILVNRQILWKEVVRDLVRRQFQWLCSTQFVDAVFQHDTLSNLFISGFITRSWRQLWSCEIQTAYGPSLTVRLGFRGLFYYASRHPSLPKNLHLHPLDMAPDERIYSIACPSLPCDSLLLLPGKVAPNVKRETLLFNCGQVTERAIEAHTLSPYKSTLCAYGILFGMPTCTVCAGDRVLAASPSLENLVLLLDIVGPLGQVFAIFNSEPDYLASRDLSLTYMNLHTWFGDESDPEAYSAYPPLLEEPVTSLFLDLKAQKLRSVVATCAGLRLLAVGAGLIMILNTSVTPSEPGIPSRARSDVAIDAVKGCFRLCEQVSLMPYHINTLAVTAIFEPSKFKFEADDSDSLQATSAGIQG
eukprot:GILJ01010163.1.p1 GENE.GILJ01010163.1~~GILJ01010163.1.p1  ORF type:complete len:422 (-),score=32.44 GILJ01010163.1:162-1427(-)